MGRLIQLLLIATVIVVGYRLLRGLLSPTPRSQFPCATCASCGTLFDDGVICVFGSKETFKNETHIANCRDYERRRGA